MSMVLLMVVWFRGSLTCTVVTVLASASALSTLMVRFEKLLDDYFESGTAARKGLPSVQYFAEELHFSANYLSDMMKKETGQNALEYIHKKIIELTKHQIVATNKTVSEIAYDLGFQYPQHLTRLFKREVGITPQSLPPTNPRRWITPQNQLFSFQIDEKSLDLEGK